MKEINMGGFENQRIGITFAGKRYEIEIDAPTELYRKFASLPRKLNTENDWNKAKGWIAEFIAFYNDINKKRFKESLTKLAVANFMNAYNEFLTGEIDRVSDLKKAVKSQKAK